MAAVTREAVMTALFNLVIGVHDFARTGRRLVLWDDVPATERPALYMLEHNEAYSHPSETLQKRELHATLFVYTDAKDATIVGATQINTILDELDAALTPSGRDAFVGNRQTLGGLVSHCYIDGEVVKDPGDLDGDGLLIVPIRILLP
jgi:hypothetical protein